LQPKSRTKHLSLRDELRSNPEYLVNEVRISHKGQENDALDCGDGSMETPKNGREQGKGKVDS